MHCLGRRALVAVARLRHLDEDLVRDHVWRGRLCRNQISRRSSHTAESQPPRHHGRVIAEKWTRRTWLIYAQDSTLTPCCGVCFSGRNRRWTSARATGTVDAA